MQPPPQDTFERSAWDYLQSERLEDKLAPLGPATAFEQPPCARELTSPGRPPGLEVATSGGFKTPGTTALRDPHRRAQLLHTFLHHEVQAAELMCWALLRFVDTPESFRRGLLVIIDEEVRHMGLYREHLRSLGHDFGDFPVRDWFWERVPSCSSPAHFVATMGMGLEGGNLDHAARFAARFRKAGDEQGAVVQEQVGAEEEGHVRFALTWFRRFTGSDDFASWRAHLPPPLSPMLMRGRPLNREARLRAGLAPAFIDELERWQAT